MKMMNYRRVLFAVFIFLPLIATAHMREGSDDNATSEANMDNTKVLVIRAVDNVKSNYYTPNLLAENTDIPEDSINQIYNEILEKNLSQTVTGLHFVGIDNRQMNTSLWQPIIKDIQLKGEGENIRADLSLVNKGKLMNVMKQEGSRYLLVIDAQYLRYSEKPMPMMYHFVNYSLYDINENKLCDGQSYFPAYEPQTSEELAKSSKKTMKKIASKINKVISNL